MGMSTVSISFFDQDIKIDVEECTYRQHWGRTLTIGRFAGKQRCSLEQIQETGEYIVRRADGAFIRGKETL